MNIKNQKGFTLIELLVVIAIIGLLSSIVLASLKGARDKATISALKQHLISFRTNAEIIKINKGYYHSFGGSSSGTQEQDDCWTSGTDVNEFFNHDDDRVFDQILKLVDRSGSGNYAYCGANKDSFAFTFRLKTNFNQMLNNKTTVCIDSRGGIYVNNENPEDNINILPIPSTGNYICQNTGTGI